MQFTPEQELEIFKRLAIKSALEVGLEYKLDQHFKDNISIRNAVQRVYHKVRDNPEKYGIAPEARQMVLDAVANRSLVKAKVEITKAEQEIEAGDIKTLVVGVRDKAFRLLDAKLTHASKSRKALNQLNIVALSTVAGTMFDKAQIIQGQATEHIALMGKIEGNINPDDALDLVLKMREGNVAAHAPKK